LERLAQAHVIGQHAAEAVGGQVSEEMKPFHLVRAQFGGDAGGQRRRHPRLDLRSAALKAFDLRFGQEFARRFVGQLECVQPLRFGGEVASVQAQPRQPLVVFGSEVELEPAPAFLAQTHVSAARVQ